jgi:hypothetical protein
MSGNPNWPIIWQTFHTPVTSIDDFARRICKYNQQVKNLNGLKTFHNSLPNAEKKTFFSFTLPGIVKIALLLTRLFSQPVPFLHKCENKSISISRYQIAALIANAFICSFPERNETTTIHQMRMGNFNLKNLFAETTQQAVTKIKAIVTYLNELIISVPEGIVTITRFSNAGQTEDSWKCNSTEILREVAFTDDTPIQETIAGLTMIDFANSIPGGGFIGHGMLQEEILFSCYPELMITRLLCEQLEDDEVVAVSGVAKFSNINGYGNGVEQDSYMDDSELCVSLHFNIAIPSSNALYSNKFQRYKLSKSIPNHHNGRRSLLQRQLTIQRSLHSSGNPESMNQSNFRIQEKYKIH